MDKVSVERKLAEYKQGLEQAKAQVAMFAGAVQALEAILADPEKKKEDAGPTE